MPCSDILENVLFLPVEKTLEVIKLINVNCADNTC